MTSRRLDLMLSERPGDDLSVVAKDVFGALGVTSFEERDSLNYHRGVYFLGRHDLGKVEVMFSSEPGDPVYQDRPFWLGLTASDKADGFGEGFADELVRSKLTPLGFKVARIKRPDGTRFDY